jgi:tRNA G37 N-methylase Trm5
MTITQDVRIRNFEVIYEERMMAHIQNHTKHDFETTKISPFYVFSSENSIEKKRISTCVNAENDNYSGH